MRKLRKFSFPAHCTIRRATSDFTVKVGSSTKDAPGMVRKVDQVISHPNFDFRNFNFDFCLMKVNESFVFGPNIQPVRLPKPGNLFKAGQACLVSGFGMNENFEYPNELQATQVRNLLVDDTSWVQIVFIR